MGNAIMNKKKAAYTGGGQMPAYETGGVVNPNAEAMVSPTKLKSTTGTGGYPCVNKADHAKFVNQK